MWLVPTDRSHLRWLALAGLLVMVSGELLANDDLLSEPQRIRELLDSGDLEPAQVPNPHWQENGCSACHASGMNDPGALHSDDINELCNGCHNTSGIGEYIHPVGMKVPLKFMERIPLEFKDAIERGGDRVTCIACHDLPMQCEPDRRNERAMNPRFFRGGPYSQRTDLCFNCHNPKEYERYNPHNQISDEGELDLDRCYVCHSALPDRRLAKSIDDVYFHLVEGLEQLCTGCHPWRTHPGGRWASFASTSTRGKGPNHLVVPSENIRRNLERHEEQHEISMPLEPGTGRIFCATCHNPHERGVQYQHRSDKGADGIKRLRRGQQQICMACHQK